MLGTTHLLSLSDSCRVHPGHRAVYLPAASGTDNHPHDRTAGDDSRDPDDRGRFPRGLQPGAGKHARMQEEMLRYRKFVSAPQPAARVAALDHLKQAGFQTVTMATPEVAELAKLLETTYLGVLIAWTQEMERLATQYGGTFSEVNHFVEEVGYLPSHIYPGAIGGHCVLPNIDLLRSRVDSQFLDLVVESNNLKTQLQPTVCTGATT